MSSGITIAAVVEGRTEQIFVEKILAPYLGWQGIWINASQVSKPGQKGGDVCFSRIQKDVTEFLRQRKDIYVTTIFDYYAVKKWPDLDRIERGASAAQIAQVINEAAKAKMIAAVRDAQVERRFIPFVAVHEFEALLFSDTSVIAEQLGVDERKITMDLSKYDTPEEIDNSPDSAPSKRLEKLPAKKKFVKTSTGVHIAEIIGIDKMREKCPLFNQWLVSLEELRTRAG